MKTHSNPGAGGWKQVLVCGAGWAVAALLGMMILPKAYHRLILRLPSVQRAEFEERKAIRQMELAVPWKDSRPLIILAGDSHIELGNWYELFAGGYAVRNCGIGRGKIEDVTQLLGVVPDRKPETVILMCGINNLSHRDTIEHCLAEYGKLLAAARKLQPTNIVVLSVMPFQETFTSRLQKEINLTVIEFNKQLEKLCGLNNARFVNVNEAVTTPSGGLAHALTGDGLHLNRSGYDRLVEVIGAVLSAPEGK